MKMTLINIARGPSVPADLSPGHENTTDPLIVLDPKSRVVLIWIVFSLISISKRRGNFTNSISMY